MAELVATTRRLDGDVDLLSAAGPTGVVFERGRAGLSGRGVAARVRCDEAAEALAAFAVDDEVGLPGCGPVAFGALPFLPRDLPAAELVIPAVVWGRAEDGSRWVTTIGDAAVPEPVPLVPARRAAPGALRLAPSRPAAEWCDLVASATAAIDSSGGALEKVVLAREVVVEAEAPIDTMTVLARLRAAYPGCFITHVGGLAGASPELLVSRAGDVVRAQPMAGTAPRGGDPATDARLAASLLANATYRHEHQVTIDEVHDTLLGWCSYVDFEPEPSVVAVANVQHLATLVEGRLSRPAPSVLELVAALHPTPAVAGRPRDTAIDWIVAHEGFDRGRYAGTVGWSDAAGNGQWAVSVRCAEIDGQRARVFAGNGIVAGSDPDTELTETQVKLQALLGAIVRL
jgi:isochorismate synthase